MGVSGRAFLHALIDGETDRSRLADLSDPRLKASRCDIEAALRGFPNGHHRFMLKVHLDLIASLDAAVTAIPVEVAALLEPFRHHVTNLMTMPGVSQTMAEVFVAETGADMSRFASADHLVSWAGLCPRNDESAGKRRTNHLRPGAAWLRIALVQCAWAASRKKKRRFESLFRRVRGRQGAKKAVVAVAAEMARCAWQMMSKGVSFEDHDPAALDPKKAERELARIVSKLKSLRYKADIAPIAAVA